MKKTLLSICMAIIAAITINAQAPSGIKYQAVARNTDGTVMANQDVTIKIVIDSGDSPGQEKFLETHNVTTNEFGLINLVIGSENKTQFKTIDWTSGEFFISVWLNGELMGRSQVLSVPYALHAKTADNITGTLPLSKGGTGATTAAAARVAIGAGTGTVTSITGGTGITVAGGSTATPTISAKTYAIGEHAHGGIVFWVDATGQHGLVAATVDQSTGGQWIDGDDNYSGITSDGLYAGAMNTALIVATHHHAGAAKVCANYSVTVDGVTYGDWYLPSKYELNLLFLQKNAVGGFAAYNYWSSTEYYNTNAWIQYFDPNSGVQSNAPKTNAYKVRAIRAF